MQAHPVVWIPSFRSLRLRPRGLGRPAPTNSAPSGGGTGVSCRRDANAASINAFPQVAKTGGTHMTRNRQGPRAGRAPRLPGPEIGRAHV